LNFTLPEAEFLKLFNNVTLRGITGAAPPRRVKDENGHKENVFKQELDDLFPNAHSPNLNHGLQKRKLERQDSELGILLFLSLINVTQII
jgi:hypothetical protein